jgi:MFS family permease
MRKFYWMMGLLVGGLFMAIKDVDWLYDPVARKVEIFVQYAVVGAVIGLCLSFVTRRALDRRTRLMRWLCWVFACALVGLALGHGNVPWLVTLRVMAEGAAVGVLLGALQYAFSMRQPEALK